MPKSKRAKVVHLTKVTKKGKEHKSKVIDTVRDNVQSKRYVHILTIYNPSTELLQALRQDLKPGRLVHGKNRLLQVAIGTSPENALEDNLWKLSGLISGDSALLATDEGASAVKAKLEQHITKRYANAGVPATMTVTLAAGIDELSKFPPTMEPTLRALGMPTILKDGKIILLEDYTVCKEGELLTVNATKLLKHLGKRNELPLEMDQFRVVLKGTWDRKTKKVSTNKTQ